MISIATNDSKFDDFDVGSEIFDETDLPLDAIDGGWRLTLLVIGLIPVAGLGAFGLQTDNDLVTYVQAILIYAAISLPIALKRRYHAVEPYSIIFAILYLGVPMKMVWALFNRDSEKWMSVMQNEGVAAINQPGWLMLLACLLLAVGYLFGHNLMIRIPTPGWGRDRTWRQGTLFWVCGLFAGISVVIFALYAQQVGLGSGALSAKRFADDGTGPMGRGSNMAYYRWAVSLSQIAFYLLLAWFLRRGVRRREVFTLLCIMSIPIVMSFLMPFVTSSRTPLAFFLVESLIVFYCIRSDAFTGRALMIQGGAIVSVVVFFMAILSLRQSGDAQEVDMNDITPIAMIDHVVGARYLADVTKFARICDAVPKDTPHLNGTSYVSALTAPIPRSSWPNKPSVGMGPHVGETVYRLEKTGVPPGLFGEAYFNFGLPGTLIIPVLFGWVCRISFEIFRPRIRYLGSAVLYAICFRWYVCALGMDMSSALVQFAMEFIPAAGVIWYLNQNGRPQWH